MEGRVASVKAVSDLSEKEVSCALARGANFGPRRGQRGIGRQAPGHVADVAIHDKSNEIKKVRLRLGHRFLVRLTNDQIACQLTNPRRLRAARSRQLCSAH